ncbi:DinB family protein [Chloroflexota bacterium]
MQCQQLIIDIYERISQELEQALDGLTVDDLNQQPCPGCNSIGWLTWHLTRVQDNAIANLLGEEQLWIKDNWYDMFNRTPDPKDTGFGHSLEDAAAFSSPDASTLFEYHRAVLGQSKRYITNKLSEIELNREFDNPVNPDVTNVRTRLMRVINDNMQHLGQVAYIRGMLKGWGWLGR